MRQADPARRREMPIIRSCGVLLSILLAPVLLAAEPTPAERGRNVLLGKAFNPTQWKATAYDKAWKHWGDLQEAPKDYAKAFMDHYGLHPSPDPGSKWPMGLREGSSLLLGKGITSDCLLCHGSSIMGKTHIGLGNSSLDVQALFEDFGKAS